MSFSYTNVETKCKCNKNIFKKIRFEKKITSPAIYINNDQKYIQVQLMSFCSVGRVFAGVEVFVC